MLSHPVAAIASNTPADDIRTNFKGGEGGASERNKRWIGIRGSIRKTKAMMRA